MAAESKDELLGQLEHYPAEDVRDVLARVGEAIGEGNAPSIDVQEHALRVTVDVLRGRLRPHFQRLLGRRLAEVDELVWLLDAEDRIIEAVSPAAAASVGYRPEELVGHSNEQLRVEGQNWEELRPELDGTGRLEGALLVRHKDGSAVAVAHETRVITIAGRRLYFSHSRVIASPVRRVRELPRRMTRAASDALDVGIVAGFAGCLCELQRALHGFLGLAGG